MEWDIHHFFLLFLHSRFCTTDVFRVYCTCDRYERLQATAFVERRPEWFIHNITDVLALISMCALGVISMPFTPALKAPNHNSGRLGYLATLLLVAVAYVLTVKDAIPRKHYRTQLDWWILTTFALFVVLSIETMVIAMLQRFGRIDADEGTWEAVDIAMVGGSVCIAVGILVVAPRVTQHRSWHDVRAARGAESEW
jgi:hypothetical protein